MSRLRTLPNRPTTAIEISEENSKIRAKLHFEKPYENATLEFFEPEEFEEFLKDFLVNQETPLRVFKFELADLKMKILQDSLKSRISLLQVRRIFLDVSDTHQLAPIFQYLNSYSLKKVILRIDEEFDIEGFKFLENWKRSGLLILALKFKNIYLENLKSINKLLYYWSTFRQIDIFYDNYNKYDPCEFFDVPFEKLSENSIRIELSPRNRLAPSLVKLKLSNEMSLKVLGNPLVMGNVLKYFKAFDIQSLRKTCNGIRSCVDHLKPDPQIGIYGIYMKTDESISANVRVSGYRNCKSILYERTEDSKDIVSKVLADFETITKHQKTCLEELRLFFSYYNLTGEPNEPLRTLIPESVRAEDVMQVLPYLDPKYLEKLEINDPHYEYLRLYNRRNYPDALKIPYDIEEMAKTEQWKNLKELEVKSERISTPIQKMNLTNLSKIYITTVARITSNDIIFLKENLLTPKLKRFIICFKTFVEDPQLNDFFGPPRNTFGTRRLWYFPIPGTNREMMEIDLSQNLYFESVNYYRYG
ncbi:Protein CBG17920 [Caenorhabditis briggsae]|uniref:Protein CBG17920 n=1 Tax=Caenorhabditis briggsae TaxID=6238 RepID=A8XS41_CAEBR|nr:Protein CBG17920 [Caenorhabditis briggsae]CAP35460.1 Protein CBG17920 [Caenorhabditis briggsae]